MDINIEQIKEALAIVRTASPATAIMDSSRWVAVKSIILTCVKDDRGFTDPSRFMADMRNGLNATPGDSHLDEDIESSVAIRHINDFIIQYVFEKQRWEIGDTPAIRRVFPAQEIVFMMPDADKVSWLETWELAGGKLYGESRMIALKSDPIWLKISDFGKPWPPFRFGDETSTREIMRSEAKQLGVI